MKRITEAGLLYCFLFCCFLFFAFPALSAEKPEMVLGTDAWPPFTINDDKSPYGMRGIDIDALGLLAEKMGVSLRVVHIPWARSLEYMKSGEIDLLTGLAYTNERAEYIRYTEIPYYTAAPAFYVSKGKAGMVRSYSDLYRYRVGYVRSSAYFEPFNSDAKIDKYPVSNEDQLLQMLVRNRVEVIIGTDSQVEYDIAQLGLRGKVEKALFAPPEKIEIYLGISKKSPFINHYVQINHIMKELIRSGEIDKLASKYFK